jgi:hypothetical protein
MMIRVTQTQSISKMGILPYPRFPICRVLCRPYPGLLWMPCFPPIQPVPGFKESAPFDPLNNLVPPVFLQLSLIFFNKHIRCGFYPLSWLLQHIFLPHDNLWVVWLDHPVAMIGGNDHVLTLGRLGLISAHQNFLVHELDHADGKWVHVELHLASIT